MIIYNVQTNGACNQLIIEVLNDTVLVESDVVAYVTGNLTLNADMESNLSKRIQSFFIGKRFFKPSYSGTGKIYLKATLGTYHKFNLENDEELVLTPNAFIACRNTITVTPDVSPSIINFISGLPLVKPIAKGSGALMVRMRGPIVEYELKDEKDKFIAFDSDIAAYSKQLLLTRELAGKGWLSISQKMVQNFRGKGKVYFSPNPNKGAMRE